MIRTEKLDDFGSGLLLVVEAIAIDGDQQVGPITLLGWKTNCDKQ
jgi:hypothetical protein